MEISSNWLVPKVNEVGWRFAERYLSRDFKWTGYSDDNRPYLAGKGFGQWRLRRVGVVDRCVVNRQLRREELLSTFKA